MAHPRKNTKEEDNLQGAINGEDDQIMELCATVFQRYVIESMHAENPDVHISREILGGSSSERDDPQVKEMVDELVKIIDDLSHNAEFQHLINTVQANCAQDVFVMVARSIFAEGLTWRRVAALFHLAYRLIYKALTQNHLEIVRSIINWVLLFIIENILAWICQQGGWEGVISHVSRWPTVSSLFAMAFITAVVYWRRAC